MRFLNTYSVVSDLDCEVLSHDGVRLSVDVYRPAGAERSPSIVVQTPYDNNRLGGEEVDSGALPSPAERYRKLAALGFMVVAVDSRGRGDSDGMHVPFATDGLDGASVISWLRASKYCNGRVGVLGAGYAAYSALATASLATVNSVLAWSPPSLSPETCTPPFVGGVPSMLWLRWLHLKGGRTPIEYDLTNWAQVARRPGLSSLAEAVGRRSPEWNRWLRHKPEVELDFDAIDAPVLLVTGWYDPGSISTISAWKQIRNTPSAELVVGPWSSAAARKAQFTFGGVDWGPAAALDPIAVAGDWFASTMGATGSADEGHRADRPKARLFLTGANVWTELSGPWPHQEEQSTWHLSSKGGANTRRGDGTLTEAGGDYGAVRGFDEFVYNPDDPAPWQPSASGEPDLRPNSSSVTLDPWFLTRRDDVLCYTSDKVDEQQVISGEPIARLMVGQDVTTADWILLLEDVFPGGDSSIVLALGTTAVVITGPEAEELAPQQVEVALSPIHHELQQGHSLRLSITASLWPLFHARSDELWGGGNGLRASTRRIYHGGDSRSELTVTTRASASQH